MARVVSTISAVGALTVAAVAATIIVSKPPAPVAAPIPATATAPVAVSILSLVPDPTISPGWVNPAITQDNIQKTICVPGYTAGEDADGNSVRAVSAATKRHVMKAYGVSRKDGPIEIDHRVPLEVGGSNDPHNLWPETRERIPYSAWDKDKLETHVHAEVCKGALTLQQGQEIFLGNWEPAFNQYFGADDAGK